MFLKCVKAVVLMRIHLFLENENEALILDLGCSSSDIKKSLNFNIRKIKGCLLSHEHG